MSLVGSRVPRLDGHAKVTGAARYVDDLAWPGMLHARTVRARGPRARLRGVTLDPAFDWTGVTVVTAADIPGENVVALIVDDQPCLAAGRVGHPEEAVALVAAADPERALAAAAHVRVDEEPEPGRFDPEQALAEGRLIKRIRIARGDAAAALARAEVVVEGEYRTDAQEHVYIEPQGMIAVPEDDGVTIHGSLQCPYYIHRALQRVLALPPERVRIVQATTGGGFGGKEEYPSMIAAHAALLARKSGRPVKLIYDRLEDMAATTKRHPARVRIRTGHARDGRLHATQVDLLLDGGAYVTLSPVVLSRAAIHAGGPYRCDHVDIDAAAVFTDSVPHGAFRGFGAPQSEFAIEAHMDRAARALGLDPAELRRRNLYHAGDVTPTGQTLRDCAAHDTLAATLRDARWSERRRAAARHNARGGPLRRGVGLACWWHGAGFTGGGETKMGSRAAVTVTPRGTVRILTAQTEIGQGTRTIFPQIVAETLGIPLPWIECDEPDTREVPDSGPTVASRTTMVVGGLVEQAARRLAAALPPGPARRFRARARALTGQVFEARYQPPPGHDWSDETYRGDAYGTYAWAAAVAEVEVDLRTYQARVLDFFTTQEVGRVIHRTLAEGQIEGGTVQAIGWALYEDCVFEAGRMQNAQLTNYVIPTALDTPPLRVRLLERPYGHGAFGAKGLGELPMDGPAAAIAAAVGHAAGVVVPRVPCTPERLLALIEAGGAP